MSPLRKERMVRQLRLEDVAKLAGIHASTLSRIERRLREPSGEEQARLATALGLAEAELFEPSLTTR